MLLRNIGNIPVLKHFRKTPFTFGNSPLGDDLPIDYRWVMSLIWCKVVILGMHCAVGYEMYFYWKFAVDFQGIFIPLK